MFINQLYLKAVVVMRTEFSFSLAGGADAILCLHEIQESELLHFPENNNIIPYPLEMIGTAY